MKKKKSPFNFAEKRNPLNKLTNWAMNNTSPLMLAVNPPKQELSS